MPDPFPTSRTPAALTVAQVVIDNREPFRQYDRPEPWFGTAPEALYHGFAALPEVQVHLVTCTQQPMVSSPAKLADNIWFHSLHVPKLGWLRTGYQGCIRAVRRKLREIRPDIVHGQGTERYAALAAVFSGFPNVLTIHGNMRLVAKINHARPFTFDWLAARLEAFTVPRTRGVICITNYTREAVAGDGVRTWLLPNAVDQEFFPIQPVAETPPIILCVGNVTVRKNQNAFIRALDPLAAETGFRLIFLGLAGDGDPYVREFKELVSSRPWITHIPWADRPVLRDWFRKAALLALPTLEDNCPMVVLEAMAAGVPVVAANVGGVPDLIEDGATGLLCNPLDGPSMAGAVSRILREPALAQLFAENARRKALATYLPEVVARRHLQIYGELLQGKPSDVENALRHAGSGD
ncbi:MAG TPA: glycosyltransferase family 4 protein [Chthoniobacter sp.]|jgi:glycosyltransferase involved in cell wall biosynthesis